MGEAAPELEPLESPAIDGSAQVRELGHHLGELERHQAAERRRRAAARGGAQDLLELAELARHSGSSRPVISRSGMPLARQSS